MALILTSPASVVLMFFFTRVDAARDVSSNATCEFTEWALDANCRNRDLVEIPPEYMTAVSMDIRNNRLQILKAGNFTGFRDLRYLDLEFNIISEIKCGAFGGCDSLLYIYLQFNSLESIQEGAFEGAASLERLFLNQNSISQLHPDAFRGLGALTGLYIGHNEISQLPQGLFRHTPVLKYLHMGDNLLTDLSPQIFAGLSDLTYLNVMNNNLNIIESGTFDPLKNLEELDLSGNLLVSINAFPTLPKLKILDLYDNEMREIGSLSKAVDGLDELYLGQNNLSCTCSMNPIRKWIQQHKSDEEVDASKVELTCPSPPHLEGKVLDSISEEELCPGGVGLGHIPTSTPTKPAATSSSSHDEDQDSQFFLFAGLSDAVIYVIVAGVTVSVMVMVLCILIRCLNWRTQRYHQQIQLQEVKLQKRQQVTHITTNRESFTGEDENPYEYVPSYSPTHDSAFGSRNTLGNDEVPPPPGQAYPESSTSSDSGILDFDERRQLHPSPPTTQIPLLVRQHPSTNPFLQDDLQAVTAPDGSILQDVLDSLSTGEIPKYTVIKFDSQDPSMPSSRQDTPHQIQHEYFIYPWSPTQHQASVDKKTHSPYKKKWIKTPRNQSEHMHTKYQPINQETYFESEKSLDESQRKRTGPFESNRNGNPFRL